MKEHNDNLVWIVFMEGTTGIFQTECYSVEEAVKLETHHKNLGYNAWIMYRKAE